MINKSSGQSLKFVRFSVGLLFAVAALAGRGDTVDEAAYRTFHLSTIGSWDYRAGSVNSVTNYRARILSLNGGVMPKNVKASISAGVEFLQSTHGGYYDYLFASGKHWEFPDYVNGESDYYAGYIFPNDIQVGVHVNGMPWADSPIQSEDILHNYLEKFGGGSLLQVDRLGRIRTAATAQDPTINEQFSSWDALEMQLTLSRNATTVQDYVGRNCRTALRILGWYREQHPDLITFASMSSEVSQNVHMNVDYSDYSTWSKQEFRDWLSGTNFYAGQGQYVSLAAFNTAFVGASGFPWASWDAVQPPTTVTWTTGTANGRWWNKWHSFRTNQVYQMVQAQINWCRDAGWSPDMLYGHQVPLNPASTADLDRKYGAPWTTTFTHNGANGITTYGADSSNTTTFAAIRANDKNWGIFEYNPLASNNVAANLAALDSVWNSQGRIVSPFMWWGVAGYQIRDSAFETAMTQFIFNHRNEVFTNLAPYEVSPTARDVIWAMSESDDVETSTDVVALQFTNGTLRGNITGANPMLSLEFAESPSRFILADAYHAASFRLFLTNSTPGFGRIVWQDEFNANHSITFPAKPGWNVYRVNLAENADWREKRIKRMELHPASAGVGAFQLDWFRLEANHCWHFTDPNEVYGVNQLTNAFVSGGNFSGVTGPDGYFYFATDKRDINTDADRAGINADTFKKLRVRMTSSAAGSAQLFWWKRGTSFFQTAFPVQAGTQTYELDLTSTAEWSGEITRFRLDPMNTDGASVSVDYVSVSPVMLPPRIANSDLIVNSSTPVFLWENAIENDHPGLTGSLEMATDFHFSNIVFSATNLTGGRLVYSGPTNLDGQYWWRIRARDGTGQVSPWATPMPMFVRVWNFNQLGDATSLNQFSGASVSAGIWQATTTGTDPYLYFNSGASLSRGINADVYKRFRCRIRVATAGSNPAQLFFFPRVNGVSGGGFVSMNLTLPANNVWQDLDIDLSAFPQWKGYINEVRIDPAGASGLTVSLDSAEFVPAADAVAPSSVWQFNTASNFEGWAAINGATNALVSGGLLTADVTATNAGIQIAPVNLSGPNAHLVQVRLRNNTAAAAAKLYWTTDGDPTFNELKSVSVAVSPNNTNLLTYSWELRDTPAWTNSAVTALRLVLATTATSGNFAMDWIRVTPVFTNAAPTFTKGANQTVLEDSGPRTVAGWITAPSVGPGSESWQVINSYVATNNNSALFAVQPAVSTAGVLTFTPATNAAGVATVSLQSRDSGGTAYGGQDTSLAQIFTVTLTGVNDAPSFTGGTNIVVDENSGEQTSPGWATSISAGPADEAGQLLTFIVTNNNNALFAAQPAVSAGGTLTFTSATNASGAATVSVRLTDDGGTANGGISNSAIQNFLITVNAVNQPPVAGPDLLYAHWNSLASFGVSNLLANDTDIDGGTLMVTGITTPTTSGGAVSLTGSVMSYQPPTNFFGEDGFNYLLSDSQGGQSTGVVTMTVIRPAITAWQMLSNGAFQIEFTGIPLTAYTLQASSNLFHWPGLSTNMTSSNGVLLYDDLTATNSLQRFYRFVWP
jgi:hypothetical protein